MADTTGNQRNKVLYLLNIFESTISGENSVKGQCYQCGEIDVHVSPTCFDPNEKVCMKCIELNRTIVITKVLDNNS